MGWSPAKQSLIVKPLGACGASLCPLGLLLVSNFIGSRYRQTVFKQKLGSMVQPSGVDNVYCSFTLRIDCVDLVLLSVWQGHYNNSNMQSGKSGRISQMPCAD